MIFLNTINDILWTYILVAVLLFAAVWFTIRTKGVQFRMLGEMVRLLCVSGKKECASDTHEDSHHSISSFQAFAVSIASRVGTGNLAGVATSDSYRRSGSRVLDVGDSIARSCNLIY